MRKRRPLSNSKTLGIAAGLVVALGSLGTLLYINRTEAVVLQVSISAPNGGVFTDSSNCVPRGNYAPLLEALTVSASEGNQPIPVPDTEWRLAGDTICVREALLNLSPDKNYKVALGSKSLGTIDASSFLTRRAEFLHVISVTQDLHGTFELNQTADSCRESATEWSCTWYPSWQVSMDLFRKTGRCKGNGGYSDIENGTRVSIYSSDDKLLSSTTLGNADYTLKSVKSRIISCQFTWTIAGIANDDEGYFVEVAKRGKVFFSTSDLRENGWALDTELAD